jgi:hypothetical protein
VGYIIATNPIEWINVDHTGAHGPIASAIVYDNEDLCHSPFYQQVTIYNDCESDWHDDTCECLTDDKIKEQALEHFTGRNFTIVVEDDEWMES